ncbi:hypothetical protein DS909_16510 [Phaeobacter gallaeciensis]|uniref:Uncharacterized protein n=2 Tax=Roseobacteraceae TaxID=2854170 RepID=A0A366WTJ9_9RHOB|nr:MULTISPECIES: hypothetical protein [Roseobacteraceae]MBT3140889.1 hypothetical protein [Falsiruegeria litorea]RBW52836.1 hypothetical protein DS909_16510 [Phaeobacter gallaeciensis]
MILNIWNSFRRLPVWVQIWVGQILMPVNLLPLAFLSEPRAGLIASLAVGGMVLNLPILLREQGLSKAMAIPHLLLWIPLVVVLFRQLRDGGDMGPTYITVLAVLLVVDAISLAFDFVDALKWWRGDRAIA